MTSTTQSNTPPTEIGVKYGLICLPTCHDAHTLHTLHQPIPGHQ